MIYRQLGESDVEISAVVFGAWAIGGWWWGGTDDDLAVDAIRAALDCGVTTIDTAPMYGFGHSEEVVGRAIRGMRDGVVIATKCGLLWDRTDGEYFFDAKAPNGEVTPIHRVLKKDSIIKECEDSLRRLGIDCIDLYQCHWMDGTTPLEETMSALVQLRDQGKVRAIGVSNFTAEAIEECCRYGPIASNQPKFSLLDRGNLSGVISWTHSRGIGTVVYSPLEQGMLTGKVTADRQFPKGDFRSGQPWFRAPNRQRALEVLDRDIRPIAEAHDATLAQVAIAWTIGTPGVTAALVGARTAEQVQANAKAANIQLNEQERGGILAAFEALGDPQ